MKSHAFTATALLLLTSTQAHAFERTQTCYPGRALSELGCKEGQAPTFVYWHKSCVPWHIDGTSIPERFHPVIQRGFETWNDVEGSALTLQYAGVTDQSSIGYDCRDRGRRNVNLVRFNQDWQASSQIIAMTTTTYHTVTGQVYDADIEFNTRHYVFDDVELPHVDPAMTMDLQHVLTHEVGHFVGLDHSIESSYQGNRDYTQATMFASTFAGRTNQRYLDDDDIVGIETIYPVEGGDVAACKSLEPSDHRSHPDFDGTYNSCTARELRGKGCRCSSADGEFSQEALWTSLLTGLFLLGGTLRARRSRA